MTRRDRAAVLAATPWPSPPGSATHPQAAWEPGEVCDCDECTEARAASPTKEPNMNDDNPETTNPRTCVVCEQVYDGDEADSTEFSPSRGFYTSASNTCLHCWLGVGPLDFPRTQDSAEDAK